MSTPHQPAQNQMDYLLTRMVVAKTFPSIHSEKASTVACVFRCCLVWQPQFAEANSKRVDAMQPEPRRRDVVTTRRIGSSAEFR